MPPTIQSMFARKILPRNLPKIISKRMCHHHTKPCSDKIFTILGENAHMKHQLDVQKQIVDNLKHDTDFINFKVNVLYVSLGVNFLIHTINIFVK